VDRFHLMAVFVAVADAESFAKAGKALGISPPAVTRAIAQLEDRIGVPLLTRTTRFVRVTEAGSRYLDDCRRILSEADEADALAGSGHGQVRGRIRVTAPVLLGKIFVTPVLLEYLDSHPAVVVDALLLDRVVHLVDEGVDVAVRVGDLPDSSLRAIRVGQVGRVVAAAPSYFHAHGTPAHPRELKAHRIIASSSLSGSDEWRFRHRSREVVVRVTPRLYVSSNDAVAEAAIRGGGMARLLSYQVAAAIKSQQLGLALRDFEPIPWPVHVVHAQGRAPSAKVRSFVDMLVSRLRADPALQ